MRGLIGLTGGIGSGKSTVAQVLAGQGAYIVDADQIAREVVGPGSDGLTQLAAEFGADIVNEDGSLNRAELASRAFSSPTAKVRLDSIMHPLIAAQTARRFADAPSEAVVVHDVPLLAELGLASNYDAVIVVDADDEIRVERLVQRGLTEDDARARIAVQATREERLAVADYLIENHGSLADLVTQVDRVWRAITT